MTGGRVAKFEVEIHMAARLSLEHSIIVNRKIKQLVQDFLNEKFQDRNGDLYLVVKPITKVVLRRKTKRGA